MSPFEQSRAILCDDQSFGVWSLIVTFFGDMAQGPDDQVSGTALTAVCASLGVKPQAMRVALHRLRKDGWIDSVKTGRKSAYFLTETSRDESAKASARIYAKSPPPFDGFTVLITPKERSHRLNSDHWFSAGPELFVSFKKGSNTAENALVSHHEGPVPDWLSRRLIPGNIAVGYRAFHLQLLALAAKDWTQLSSLVHGWRRLVLKHKDLPTEAFPPDCPISECYESMFQLLAQLSRPHLMALE
jgi:phenylacetic acid degradation operon negative regulatory protein